MYFSPDDIEGLRRMTGGDVEPEDQHVFGSALTPGTVMGKDGKKEIAKPNAKVEVKTYNRALGGGATEESMKAEAKQKSENAPENKIFVPKEVDEQEEEMPDDRAQPEYEILYK